MPQFWQDLQVDSQLSRMTKSSLEEQQDETMETAKPPPTLYRFFGIEPCTWSDANGKAVCFKPHEELLLRGKLYFSNPIRFNDPYDPLPSFEEVAADQFGQNPTTARFPEVTAAVWADSHDYWNQIFRSQLSEKSRFVCLSTALDRSLMWSHYASKHQGVAIQFDFSKEPLRACLKTLGLLRKNGQRKGGILSGDFGLEKSW